MRDQLQHRLTALADDMGSAVRVAPVDQVRARGDRRRSRFLASQAAAMGVLVVLGLVAAGLAGGPSTAEVAAGPQIPDALRLPREGAQGWQRNDDPRVASAFPGCGTVDPTGRGRTDARTATGPGSAREVAGVPARVTMQLFLYDTDQDAAAAFAALRRSVDQCNWTMRLEGSDAVTGDELWASHYTGTDDSNGGAQGEYLAGFRSGNAIFLTLAAFGGGGWSSYISALRDDVFLDIGEQLCTHMRICGVWSPGRGSAGPSVPPYSGPEALPSGAGASPAN
ncbi:hypothetical protein [Dactylosporangium sp. CA-233914]|uniref:hypothetical protein n=1 Tax=Dactylosporangium sp. CA-233914 TaxID=3239934 RepID=UPI003D90F0B9